MSEKKEPNFHCAKCKAGMIVAGMYGRRKPYDGSNSFLRYTCHECGSETVVQTKDLEDKS